MIKYTMLSGEQIVRGENGIPARQPDFIFANGEFWFEEMVAIIDFEADYIGPCGIHVVYIEQHSTHLCGRIRGAGNVFRFHEVVDKAHENWKKSKAESILING